MTTATDLVGGLAGLHPLVVDESLWTPDELAIIDGYVAAELADVKADAIPDENDPILDATHVDPMLGQTRLVIRTHRLAGQASRYPTPDVFVIHPERIEMADATSARLWVCETADGDLYEIATGAVVDGQTTSVRELAGMRLVNGQWLLSERVEQGVWEGADGCGA